AAARRFAARAWRGGGEAVAGSGLHATSLLESGFDAQVDVALECAGDGTAVFGRFSGFDKGGFVHIRHAAAHFECARDDFEAVAHLVEGDRRTYVKRLRC